MTWNLKKLPLGKVATFRSGGTPSKSRPDYRGGKFPWVSAKDLKSPIVMDSLERLTTAGFACANIAPENSLLMLVRRMTLYKDVPVCLAGRDVAFNQDIKALVVSDAIAPKYLLYFLHSQKYKLLDLVDSAGHGTGRLDTNSLKAFPVLVPPLPEQTAIAGMLSTWDEAIEKTERLIAAKEKCYSWLFQNLIDYNCIKWKHLRADKIFKSISEKGCGGAELLSVTQDRGLIPRTMLEGRVMSPEGGADSYKLIKAGDFAISLRSFQGGIEYSQYQGLISPAYTVLRPKAELHDEFYRHFFKSHLFIQKYLSIAVIGIRDGKQISIPDFMTVKIPLPPINQQQQIAVVLNTARQEIDLLKKQADAYRRQKRGLLQKLLTGKWRVKTCKEEV